LYDLKIAAQAPKIAAQAACQQAASGLAK